MSKNNTITKSDKTFIRREKARIRTHFLDPKKQTELIDALYVRFLAKPQVKAVAPKVEAKKVEAKKPEVKKEAPSVKTTAGQGKKVTAKATK